VNVAATMRAAVRHAGRLGEGWWRTVRAEASIEGTIVPPVNVWCDDLSNLRVGHGSIVYPFSEIAVIAQAGGSRRRGLYIGARTTIGTGANLRGSGGIITIGDDCLFGQYVSVIAADHGLARDRKVREQPWSADRVDVVIEDDVHVGTGAIVLPGSVLRHGAVVAAGAVVRGEVDEHTIVAGTPARPVGVRR
jgi:carbonic anhydrase/acetyltransferase-like protein (isoleucine patch superfamily)